MNDYFKIQCQGLYIKFMRDKDEVLTIESTQRLHDMPPPVNQVKISCINYTMDMQMANYTFSLLCPEK